MSTKVYGCSDDLVEFEGTLNVEENMTEEDEFEFIVDNVKDGTSVYFYFVYTDLGCWKFKSTVSDDDLLKIGFVINRLPEDWDESMEEDLGYSDVVVIPDDYKKLYRYYDGDLTIVAQVG